MTTPLVQSITDELVADLDALASKATGGEWDYHMGLIRTMPDSDGYVPVAIAPNCPSNWRKQRDRNMQHIAAANPATILALLAERKELVRDRERLDSLDKLCEAYGFEVHEGNRWVIDGPFRSVRDAIDSLPDDAAIDAARGGV